MKGLATRISPLVLAIAGCIASCNPTHLPGAKRIAKKEDERITRETEDAIKKSPVLQELDRLCTQEIPRPEGFVLVDKHRGLHEKVFLGYGYSSGAKYQEVKRFYTSYFGQHNWQLTKEKDSGWGPSNIEFSKDGYRVNVEEMIGGADVNYAVVCEKLPNSLEEK